MKYLVTGATGFIGYELVKQLLKNEEWVNILIRSVKKTEFPFSEKLTAFFGDLSDYEQIEGAMKGCYGVFHLAAFVNTWAKNKNLPYEVNVSGTNRILSAAMKLGIKRVVFTSTAGVLKSSDNYELVDELSPLPETFPTIYEKTKFLGEKICNEYYRKGLDVVIVSPSRVYGPGLLSVSNSFTRIINDYLNGRWRFIPGNGESTGNFVFIDDVVDGLIKAMALGKPGEKYILGGVNVSFNQLFDMISETSGIKRDLIKIPPFLMSGFANLSLIGAEKLGLKPLITPGLLKKFLQNRLISSIKAETQINYMITPLKIGLEKTIKWLRWNQY